RLEEASVVLGELGLDTLAQELLAHGIRKVALVPYGWLGLFPLHAALVSHPSGSKRYLGDIFEVTFAPSARSIEVARGRSQILDKRRQVLLFAGNPQPLLAGARDLPCAEAEADTLRRITKRYGYSSTQVCYLR